MPRIVVIAEGHGEVQAVPVLIRRIAAELAEDIVIDIPPPIRRSASKLLNQPEEFRKNLELAALTAGQDGALLILLDCDDTLPCKLGPDLTQRARMVRPGARIFVTLAYREFESWFIAAAESLAGKKNLSANLRFPKDFENRRDAKGWLTENMSGTSVYKETAGQASLTAQFDLSLARQRSHSFRRFWRICNEMFVSLRNQS